jgi:hypothetical protein
VGSFQPTPKTRPKASRRKPRPRLCLRQGCGQRYQPKRWNQRYCPDPECGRLLRRWQARRRQAERRKAAEVRRQHAAAQQARRQRAKSTPQDKERPSVACARGHGAKNSSRPLCARPGCHQPPRPSACNPARYCGLNCRRAVRQVLDRERKWRSRGTLDGRKKRGFEYAAARAARQQAGGRRTADSPRPKHRE